MVFEDEILLDSDDDEDDLFIYSNRLGVLFFPREDFVMTG